MATKESNDTDEKVKVKTESQREINVISKMCGIIMPIAKTEGYPESHWADVLEIITETFSDTEFAPRLVSNKDSIGLIHESIVTNIYSDELVVCDVSSRNPNVMFELGLRLAFDKPVIIIKDEKTPYSFDTSPIEHLSYPSSLRFREIIDFKQSLRNKALATYKHYSENPDESPYLKSFNKLIVSGKIKSVEVSDFQYVIDKINNISGQLEHLTNNAETKSNVPGDILPLGAVLVSINSRSLRVGDNITHKEYGNGVAVGRGAAKGTGVYLGNFKEYGLKPFITTDLVLNRSVY